MTTEIQKTRKGEITLNDVQEKIITIQNKNILLDSDVAWLYGVETKELQTTGTETSFEINLFSAVKIKHTIKKEVQ